MTGDYLLDATRKLTGLDTDRVMAARERIQGFGIAHLTAGLVDTASIDAAVAAVLLVDSLDGLTEQGIERTKLLSKLRNDRDVWPTWAELRAAHQISRNLAEGAEMHLELGRSQGRHPDFHITRQGGSVFAEPIPSTESSDVSIEFKALGLSDDEAAFCLRVRQIERKPRVILDQPDRATARLDSLLRERVEIDHRAAGDEELMDVAQGVHDALSLNSSQGMREERQVERHMRGVHFGRPRDRERNAIGELGR